MPALVTDNSGFGEWRARLIKNDRGRPIDCRENVYLILREHQVWKGRLAFDEFAQRVILREAPEIDGFAAGEWTAESDLLLGLWLAHVEGIVCRNESTLALGVAMAANAAKLHPVREFLAGLVWDEVPRLEDWLADFLGVRKTPYTMAVGAYFLVNLVWRVQHPGCIMRSVPVLEGPQNRGKSTALRILAEPWFSDTHLDLGSKDAFSGIQGVWLYEISEMDSFTRSEASRVKEFVSSREDNFRPSYGRRNVRLPRQVMFAGTINQSVYLKDWTGNTRYWPFAVEQEQALDLDGLAAARDQLLAEAMVRYGQGVRRHPTREEEDALFRPEQEEREVQHPWEPIIAEYLRDLSQQKAYPRAILADALKFEPSKLLDTHSQTVGRIMHRLGWVRKRESSGERRYYYEPLPRPKEAPQDPSEVPF